MAKTAEELSAQQQVGGILSSNELYARVSQAKKVVVSKGRHFQSFRRMLSQANLFLIHQDGGKRGEIRDGETGRLIPFSTLPDESIAPMVSQARDGVVGLGCHHQYVEARSSLLRPIDYAHLAVVPEARFVLAAHADRIDETKRKLADGELCRGGSEYVENANHLAKHLDLNVYFERLPRGSNEVAGDLRPDLDVFAAIGETLDSLRGEKMELISHYVAPIILDVFTQGEQR